MLDIEVDMFERILRDAGTVRDHDRDRFSDIADPIHGNDRLLVGKERRQRLLPQRNRRNGGAKIGRRQHGMHAWQRQRRASVDLANAAVRHRTSKDRRMQQARAHHVVDIFSPAAKKAQVFEPLNWASNQGVANTHRR